MKRKRDDNGETDVFHVEQKKRKLETKFGLLPYNFCRTVKVNFPHDLRKSFNFGLGYLLSSDLKWELVVGYHPNFFVKLIPRYIKYYLGGSYVAKIGNIERDARLNCKTQCFPHRCHDSLSSNKGKCNIYLKVKVENIELFSTLV